ncbi:MAG: type II toxin-antitoxin system HicA family toxin [Candidatus Sumerlaeia bacterium]|nr:type II toxin-antitoxin system HicA family toxin [Candidatus Sumerlaeia bacterium]
MKLPRDLSGKELCELLSREFGYVTTRQRGSHIRVTTHQNGIHHLTLPAHDPVKIGTLSSILSDVASHFSLSREETIARLFGK